ncbi:hypothetical protein D3C86_1953010 [compost metagenome]
MKNHLTCRLLLLVKCETLDQAVKPVPVVDLSDGKQMNLFSPFGNGMADRDGAKVNSIGNLEGFLTEDLIKIGKGDDSIQLLG